MTKNSFFLEVGHLSRADDGYEEIRRTPRLFLESGVHRSIRDSTLDSLYLRE